MATPWRAIAFVAGVATAVAASDARAQPVVSPRQVDAPSPSDASRSKAAPKAAAPAKPAAAKAAKSAPAKYASSKKSASSSAKSKATKTAKSSKTSTKTAKSSKTSTKTAKSSKSAAPKASARVASSPKRRGGDNMPRGFAWPPTPAMEAAARACEADLDTLGVTWKRAAPEGRIVAPVEVLDGMLGGIKYTSKWRPPPHKYDCQLARALAQIGPDLHALGVREVRWGSIYRWSNVRTQGTELPFLSRHALGLAMDIVEFVDDTGRTANVEHDYTSGNSLLLGIEQLVNTSGKFRIVLTPKNDPQSHDDHFHVEANPDYSAP